MSDINVYCFGSRGSLPSPSRGEDHILGPFSTAKYGGNTTNYYVEAGPFKIVLDGGSGARELGNYLMKNGIFGGNQFLHLFSHYHSDHLQGLGFLAQYFMEGNVFHIHGHTPEGKDDEQYLRNPVESTISEQYEPPHFPVGVKQMPASKNYTAHSYQFSETFWYHFREGGIYEMCWQEPIGIQDEEVIKITTIPLHHPNGCIGFRIDYMNSSFAFCTDNEPMAFNNREINKHAKDVDLIVLDGQYTEQQLSGMTQGFGHGMPSLCVDQAVACGAKRLLIHHFDPGHCDNTLDEMAEYCSKYFDSLSTKNALINVEFVKEGGLYKV